MKHLKNHPLRNFLILWSTQSLSQLGSALTCFALTLWLFEKTGSALSTSALTICSNVPYVLTAVFAGALTDHLDKKKVMLVTDTLVAMCTMAVFVLYRTGQLAIWHLYGLNAFAGLMNSIQQPASEVAMTLLIPRDYYQKASGLQSMSRSLISILNPLIATALYTLAGLDFIIGLDLASFLLAFTALLLWVPIPRQPSRPREKMLAMAREGLGFLKRTPMVFTLILFMAWVNLVSSAYDAALTPLVLTSDRGSETVLGIVTSCSGLAMLAGSLLVGLLPRPRDRVQVVYLTMLFSLGTENFLLAFCREPVMWCIAQIIGWILVPVMSANLDVILRNSIPLELQGRVYACRNAFQFFTIPIGLAAGGILVDNVCSPFMAAHADSPLLATLFGSSKSAGAALVMFLLGIAGTTGCLLAGQLLKNYHFQET